MRKISMLLITLAVASVLASLSAQVALPAGQAPSVPGGVARLRARAGSAAARYGCQPQPTGTGRIRGRVVAAVTNAPLRRVQMSLQWSENPQFRPIVMTDAEGRYEFAQLPPAEVLAQRQQTGLCRAAAGQRRPYEGGTSIRAGTGDDHIDRLRAAARARDCRSDYRRIRRTDAAGAGAGTAVSVRPGRTAPSRDDGDGHHRRSRRIPGAAD